jgi:SNF2 family DNA or RNA helicase
MIRFDLADTGVASLQVTGRHFFRVQRELSGKQLYYGAFFGKKSQLWYFSFHNYQRVKDYVSGLDDEKCMSREFKSTIGEYLANQEIIQRVKDGTPAPEILVQNLNYELRPYQVIGAAFLRLVERALLADDMGLGKTPQTISAALSLVEEKGISRILIVCPSSLKYQWKSEIRKFAPGPYGEEAVVIEGPAGTRHQLYGSKLFSIVNYELIRNDLEVLKAENWDLIVLDEAQRIKSRGRFKTDRDSGERVATGCKTTAAIKELDSRYRFAITGTPIENSIVDMFSILEFLDPMIFGSIASFKKRYMKETPWGAQTGTNRSDELKRKLSPVVMRREKQYVLTELPPFTENEEPCPLIGGQKKLYEDIEAETLEALNAISDKQGRDLSQAKFEIIAKLIYLREVCDSPELIDPDIRESGKLSSVLSLLEDLPGKVLIFTQFESMSRILERDIETKFGNNLPVFRLHGGVDARTRDDVKEIFNHIDRPVVLVTTDCSKYGVNLQAARWVFNYDLPYNPAVISQRIGRAHRDGMDEVERLVDDQNVSVINFTVPNSIEDRVKRIIETKRLIFSDIMTDQQILHKFTVNELRFILTGQGRYNPAGIRGNGEYTGAIRA